MKRIYYTTARTPRLSQLLAHRRPRRRRAEADAARARLLAAVAGGVSRCAAERREQPEARGAAQDRSRRRPTSCRPNRAALQQEYTRDYAPTTRKRSRRWTSSAPTKARTTRAIPRGWSTRASIDALRAAYFAKRKAHGEIGKFPAKNARIRCIFSLEPFVERRPTLDRVASPRCAFIGEQMAKAKKAKTAKNGQDCEECKRRARRRRRPASRTRRS